MSESQWNGKLYKTKTKERRKGSGTTWKKSKMNRNSLIAEKS